MPQDMLYAISTSGDRIRPQPGWRAKCPGCSGPVIAKCGELNASHWAHVSGVDCDRWYEPETQWHLKWKDQFKEQRREVVVGPHRADILTTVRETNAPCVIELQHSPIDVDEIRERELFYPDLYWILDGATFRDHCEIGKKVGLDGLSGVTASFRWRWPRKSWCYRNRPLYLDFGDCLWELLRIDDSGLGTVRYWTYHAFLAQFTESIGDGLPIHWRRLAGGSLRYRFGLGDVLIYKNKNSPGYKLAVYHNGAPINFRDGCYRTIEEAQRKCEPHMGTLMRQSGKYVFGIHSQKETTGP